MSPHQIYLHVPVRPRAACFAQSPPPKAPPKPSSFSQSGLAPALPSRHTWSTCSCFHPHDVTPCWPMGRPNKPPPSLSDSRSPFGPPLLPRPPYYHVPPNPRLRRPRHHAERSSRSSRLHCLPCLTMPTPRAQQPLPPRWAAFQKSSSTTLSTPGTARPRSTTPQRRQTPSCPRLQLQVPLPSPEQLPGPQSSSHRPGEPPPHLPYPRPCAEF